MFSNEYSLAICVENKTTGKNSGWIKEAEYLDENLKAETTYQYTIKLKDTFGNIKEIENITVRTDSKQFNTFIDDFSGKQDWIKKTDIKNSIWTGISGYRLEECEAAVKDGRLILASGGRNFQANGKDNGPFLYREVAGDFLAEVEIADFSGLSTKRGVNFNEGGLMVMLQEVTAGKEQELLHLGTFPYYNVGNMLTVLSHGRPQFRNDKAWEMDRFLQVERRGEYFFFRTSVDGKTWVNMQGSPFHYPEAAQKSVKIGLYQVTYTPDKGYVAFDNFKLWTPRK